MKVQCGLHWFNVYKIVLTLLKVFSLLPYSREIFLVVT